MGKPLWAVATVAAFTLAAASCVTTSQGPESHGDAGDVTVIGFTETSNEPGGHRLEQDVRIHIAHDEQHVKSMRFATRIEGAVVEERLWDAAEPETITIRTWQDCRQTAGEMPAPRPETLDVVLQEYFGPRTVPATHTTSGDGSVTWQVRMDAVATKTFTDDGTEYPASRTVRIGSGSAFGTTITRGFIDNAEVMPAWAPGWDSC